MESFGERLRRAEAGEYYTPAQTMEFLALFGKPAVHKHKKKEYLDLICALDTESTSFEQNGVKLGTMYVWMFGCNGAVMIGRTWEQFEQFFAIISEHYKLGPKRHLICYVHNLGWDFQFFRKHFEWEDIFAREERTPMYARTTTGIEFRCSYILTNSNLDTVGKNLIRYPVKKKVGDLDYRLPRHYATPLTDQELGYCINDVLVVMSLIYDRRILEHNNIARIPLTQTGYARRECRSECLYKDKNHWKYLELMRTLSMTEEEFTAAKLGFAGGFTHASPLHVGMLGQHLASFDFTSSYPAVMVSEKFPMSQGVEIDPGTIEDTDQFNKMCREFCVLMILEFDHIKSRSEQEFYISESKCKAENPDVFNGRIASADNLVLSCTDIDWELIQQCYTWKHFRILRLWRYKKAYLPTPYVKTVLELYKRKTELKGVKGEEENYARLKERLNSLFGVCATQFDKDNIIYSEQEWSTEKVSVTDSLSQYNRDTRRFISFLWALWITAAARRNLWTGILALGVDYWYSDTDSVKVSNYKDHMEYFDTYNKMIISQLEKACKYHKLPVEYVRPKTIYGVEKPLGVWDLEETDMVRFKTLGAKRYMYTLMENGTETLHITVAGVGKKPAIAYLWYKYKTLDNIFEAFSDGLFIPGEYVDENGNITTGTGKSTHMYNDREFDADLTDYLGYTAPVHELSCINLSPADYSLGIAGAFWKFLKDYWQGLVTNRI